MNTNLSMDFIKENCETIGDLQERVKQFNSQQDRTGNKLNTSKQTKNSINVNHLFFHSYLTPADNFPLLIKLCEYTKYKITRPARIFWTDELVREDEN